MSSILKGLMSEKSKEVVDENQTRQDELQFAHQQAKNITKQIKYDTTVRQIITEIELLAEKNNIDKDSLETAIQEVINAQRQLEAAVYGLDGVFEEAMNQSQFGDELNETDIVQEAVKPDELADELFNKYPNIVRQYGHEVVGDTLLKVLHRSPNKDLDLLVDEVISTLKLTLHKTDEGQIYSTGGGAGEGRRKYRIKPAGL